jgi:hypothetical protein
MISRFLFISLLIIIPAYYLYGQTIDIEQARTIFKEYEEICRRDNGILWGISLYGPLMIVDRESRSIIANIQDTAREFKKHNDIFLGSLPESYAIGNTTFNWNGQQWTMVIWPVSDNIYERNQLLFHECFHRVQVKLGINILNTENPHLDTKQGRIWLQLEWMALLDALNTVNNSESIQDALVFRNYRRSLFPDSDSTENTLELLEGIPEYTGIKLSGRDSMETLLYFSEMVETAKTRSSFFRTFPYTSGPLYCFLIERIDPLWRKNIHEINDLGNYLKETYSLPTLFDLQFEAEKRAKKYDGEELIKLETEREKDIIDKKNYIIATYLVGPRIILPIKTPNIEFSPLNMMAIDDKGTYYKTFRLVDAWGILEAEEGSFIVKDWSALHISAVDMQVKGFVIYGRGWKLNLKDGWILSPVKDSNSYTLLRR